MKGTIVFVRCEDRVLIRIVYNFLETADNIKFCVSGFRRQAYQHPKAIRVDQLFPFVNIASIHNITRDIAEALIKIGTGGFKIVQHLVCKYLPDCRMLVYKCLRQSLMFRCKAHHQKFC